MPLYEYWCHDCQKTFDIRRPFEQASNPAMCTCMGTNTQRFYGSIAFSMPGKSEADSWNDWYDGREAAVGMSRERTQQLARHHYQQSKGNTQPVAPKRSVSTPGNPSPHQKLPD